MNVIPTTAEPAGSAVKARLRAVCIELGLAVTEAQLTALDRYRTLLQRWNAVYNLTAVRNPAQMLTQHLADCLAVVGPLGARFAEGENRLLDVGSGAGLPGLVLAVMLPHLQVVCVDAVGKKAAFIQQAVSELRLANLTVVHARVERLHLTSFDGVISRAFASLDDFVGVTQHLLKPGGICMAMKGRWPNESEAEPLPPRWRVFHVERLTVPGLDAERCLIWLERTRLSAQTEGTSPEAI